MLSRKEPQSSSYASNEWLKLWCYVIRKKIKTEKPKSRQKTAAALSISFQELPAICRPEIIDSFFVGLSDKLHWTKSTDCFPHSLLHPAPFFKTLLERSTNPTMILSFFFFLSCKIKPSKFFFFFLLKLSVL